MNLANKLTVFRILLVPIMVIIPFFNIQGAWLGVPKEYCLILLIFIIASITDKLDGYIARTRNQITTFGKFLDPLADKILVISALVMLVEFGKIPAWIPIIVLAREFIVSGYRMLAVEKNGEVIAANMWGKVKTATQMVAIPLTFIDSFTFGAFLQDHLIGFYLVLNIASTLFMLVSVIATVFSGWTYIKNGKELLNDK